MSLGEQPNSRNPCRGGKKHPFSHAGQAAPSRLPGEPTSPAHLDPQVESLAQLGVGGIAGVHFGLVLPLSVFQLLLQLQTARREGAQGTASALEGAGKTPPARPGPARPGSRRPPRPAALRPSPCQASHLGLQLLDLFPTTPGQEAQPLRYLPQVLRVGSQAGPDLCGESPVREGRSRRTEGLPRARGYLMAGEEPPGRCAQMPWSRSRGLGFLRLEETKVSSFGKVRILARGEGGEPLQGGRSRWPR